MLLLSLLIPFWLGSFLVWFLFRVQMPRRSYLLMKCCLAVGIGSGISSCGFFLWSVVFHPARDGFVLLEIIFSLGLGSALFYAVKSHGRPNGSHLNDEQVPRLRMPSFLPLVFFIALIAATMTIAALSWNSPHGVWDGWAIWNMRARFLFRSGDQWRNTFSNSLAWSHPDYPLLIPALIARCWSYIGHETTVVPAAVSILFTFATAGLIFSSLSILRSTSQGLLAGLALLGTPFFIQQGASQEADIPLGFFFLATMVLLCLHDRLAKHDYSLLFLAGMTAGFSAWTKNEGLLFLAVVIVSRIAMWALAKKNKVFGRQLFSFAVGLGPILAMILYFKTQLAPPNDLLSSQGVQTTLDRLTDGSRYWQIGKTWAEEMIHFGNWAVSLPLLLAFYIAVVGIKLEERDRRGIASALIILCNLLAGYFFVYVISPYDLQWHLATSLKRLLLQVWPSALFTFFLLVSTPEESLQEKNCDLTQTRAGRT